MIDQTRNLNPTPEAYFAMFHWHNEYAYQSMGSMDFYDSLSESKRAYCLDAVRHIKGANNEK